MTSFLAVLLVAAMVLGTLAAALRHRLPRLAAVTLGIATCFALCAFIDVGVSVIDLGDPRVHVEIPPDFYAYDGHGILQPAPGAHRVVATKIAGGEVLYDVVCTADANGRRVTPQSEGPYTASAVFVGDGFVFGKGVNDGETLPALFARENRQFHVYNYGMPGAGPFDVLARLETLDVGREIPESLGAVIYTFVDDHVLRTRDFFSDANLRGERIAYEPSPDGRLVRCLNWAFCHPRHHQLMCILGQSRILQYTHFEQRFLLRQGDIDRTIRAIEQMDETVKARWPHAVFEALFYPGCRLTPRIAPALWKAGVNVVDLSDAFDGTEPPYVFSPDDRHPTAAAYQRLVEAMKARRQPYD